MQYQMAKVEQQGRQAISNDNGNNRGPTLSSQNYLSSRKPSSDICQSALIEFPSPLLTIRNLVGDLSWLPLSRCSVHGLHFMHRHASKAWNRETAGFCLEQQGPRKNLLNWVQQNESRSLRGRESGEEVERNDHQRKRRTSLLKSDTSRAVNPRLMPFIMKGQGAKVIPNTPGFTGLQVVGCEEEHRPKENLSGIFHKWQYADWFFNNKMRSRQFELNFENGQLTVIQPGLYLLYSQITLKGNGTQGYHVMRNNQDALLACYSNNLMLQDDNKTSCFTMGVFKLEKNDQISIKHVSTSGIRAVFTSNASFFGLVRLGKFNKRGVVTSV
uniref:Uncharacterized protein LOC111136382 isoform X2 n=1 Tax=Crassostrea virginica TaxID=6565 RepID=A0A8B8ESH4_CRAVI|nr:uncharacterized protein LOC111136382 isoform X2 [Crassostrea virginica]